jgi:hypothetical protein
MRPVGGGSGGSENEKKSERFHNPRIIPNPGGKDMKKITAADCDAAAERAPVKEPGALAPPQPSRASAENRKGKTEERDDRGDEHNDECETRLCGLRSREPDAPNERAEKSDKRCNIEHRSTLGLDHLRSHHPAN